jgi:hypothetical protein
MKRKVRAIDADSAFSKWRFLPVCRQKVAMRMKPLSPDPPSCLIQHQDTVAIPPLSDPQLQQAAFSVLEAAKSQLAELKLADLFAQQLPPDKSPFFISEFLYHWTGIDSKPPESIVASSKKALHSIIRDFFTTYPASASAVSDLLISVLPHLTCAADLEDIVSRLNRYDNEDVATFSERRDSIESLQAQKRRDIQRAFTFCLSRPMARDGEEETRMSMSTTKAVIGSEATTGHTPDSDDAEGVPTVDEPEELDVAGIE